MKTLVIEFSEKSWAPDIAGSLCESEGKILYSHVSSSKDWLLQDLTVNFKRNEKLLEWYPEGFEIVWKNLDEEASMPKIELECVWNEPDPEDLDRLTRFASFAADTAVISAAGQVSAIRNPDGSPQGLTDAELTRVGIRAALRMLLANGLIKVEDVPDDFMVQIDPPPTIKP